VPQGPTFVTGIFLPHSQHVNNSWFSSLIEAQGDGTALANSTSETSILPAAAKITLQQNFFRKIGDRLWLRASGRVSTVVTSPGTLTLKLKFGAAAAFDGGAMTLNIVAKTNTPWEIDAHMTLRAIGASAQFFGFGKWISHAVIGSSAVGTAGAGTQLLPYNAAPAVGATWDSTATQVVDLTATWSTADANNSIQLHQYELILCN